MSVYLPHNHAFTLDFIENCPTCELLKNIDQTIILNEIEQKMETLGL